MNHGFWSSELTITPGWFTANEHKQTPCKCDKKMHVPIKLAEHTGYSDSYMVWRQCPKCKADWVYYLEG